MAGFNVVEVPQWQGSGSATARRLVRGAGLLADLVPAGERLRADVDGGAGPARDGVTALDVLVRNLHAGRIAQARVRGQAVLTVGGDCGVELAPVEAAVAAYGRRLAVVWFDAHGDLNTPASSPSGAFHGMILRTLLGDGPPGLTPLRTLSPAQVVLAGVRALDPAERAFVEERGITYLGVPRLAEPSALADAVAATGADAVYVHVDLDVLDPELFASVGAPEPRGLTPDRLAAAVAALAARFTLAGVGVTEYEPAHPGDHDVVAGLVGGFLGLIATQSRSATSAGRFT